MLNYNTKHIQRVILITLLFSNIFTFNSFNSLEVKNNSDKNLIIESLATQDVIISVIKTAKIHSQKNISGTSFIISDNNSGLVKFKNFVKTIPNHFRLLNFQFFLSSQFSTDT